MKYKLKVDISKEEIDSLFGWLAHFVSVAKDNKKVIKKVVQEFGSLHQEDADSLSDEEEDDSLDWEDEEPSQEKETDVHEPLNLQDYQKEDLDPEIEKGKKVAFDLFSMWIENFGIEETEQPDRGGVLDGLSKSIKGRYLYKFFYHKKHVEGKDTTLILRDIYADDVSDKLVRDIAGNFTQVSSILFPQLSDFMKYPNPLTNEDD